MGTKQFSEVLQDLRFGTLHDELSDKMQDLVNACISTGKGGALTLKIMLKPGRSGELEISDKVDVKTPELARGTSIMWATPEGNLQRNDPRQMTIEGLKDIGRDERPLKTI